MKLLGTFTRSKRPKEFFGVFYWVETAKRNFWRLLPGKSGQMEFLETSTVRKGDLKSKQSKFPRGRKEKKDGE